MSPTPGEQAAREGFGFSVKENAAQMAMTEESRRLLGDLLEERMRIAVAEGIEAVITNEQVWAKVFTVLQEQAAERTGRFVLGGVTAVLKKAAWLGIALLVAYSIGGWTLLKTVWAALSKG